MLITAIFIFTPSITYGATSPYDIEQTVKDNWNKTYGHKTYDMTSGKNIVYDIYSTKYTPGGYQIISKNFGNGSKQYINFQGWAILFGYKHHTSTNHETYIVAKKTSGSSGIGTTKIYGTIPINISATEDLEYNNQGPNSVYNECPSYATNKDNQYDCNFRYDNVGFNAYLPLDELFPKPEEHASWTLYLVKRVDSHIVYTPLVLPFYFGNKEYYGGQISLSSGINTNNLQMIGTYVLRRSYPRQPASEVINQLGSNRYFSTNSFYERVSSDETETTIWYGVKSHHDNNATKWANTAYWLFGGTQATIEYIPENQPPTHIEHSISNHEYRNGDDYWVKEDDSFDIRLRQRDPESGNRFQYVRLAGYGVDARSQHDFLQSDTHNYHWDTDPNVVINSAKREENTQYGKVKWNVTAKTHGHSYNVLYYYTDRAGNNTGPYYTDTGMNVKVDGRVPEHNSNEVSGHRYQNGNDYWTRPNDSVDIRIRQYDPHSGNKTQYLSLLGSGLEVRSEHLYYEESTYNRHFWTSSHVSIDAANREENTEYGKIKWTVTPKTHGHQYDIRYYFTDNVNNRFTDYVDTGKNLRVDGVGPQHLQEEITDHRYQNGSTYWIRPNDVVNVILRADDPHSGLKETGLSTGGGSDRSVALHSWNGSSTNINHAVTSSHFSILSVERTYMSGSTKEVTFRVKGNTHGASHIIRHRYKDNVDNLSDGDAYGWSSATKTLAVDGQAPNVQYRNISDTSYFENRGWSVNPIEVRLKFSDGHSGHKRSRYAWTQSTNTPSSWSSWTTSSNYVVSTSGYGQWYLHVQAEDNVGNIVTLYKGPYRFNDAPNADFTANPNPTDRITDVTFTDASSDPNGNSLSWDWDYRKKGSSSWNNMSNATNPTFRFNDLGTFEVRLTVTDIHGASDSTIKEIVVNNLDPVADFNLDKSEYFIGDTVNVTGAASDPEGDSLTYDYSIKAPDGVVTNKNTPNFSFVFDQVGNYEITLVVEDEYGAQDTIIKIVYVQQLTLTGYTDHTPEWQAIHQEKGNLPHQYYSGETILLRAEITDYTANYVEATLTGRLVNGNIYTRTVTLTKQSNTVYVGEINGEDFVEQYPLRNGNVTIDFEVEYINGQIRNDTVTIEIIGNALSAFSLHRLY